MLWFSRRKLDLDLPDEKVFFIRNYGGEKEDLWVNVALHPLAPIAGLATLVRVSTSNLLPEGIGPKTATASVIDVSWKMALTPELLASRGALEVATRTRGNIESIYYFARSAKPVIRLVRATISKCGNSLRPEFHQMKDFA